MTNKFAKNNLKKAVAMITSWSFSRYKKWSECPASAKYKFLDKIEEPQWEAMARGERIGKLAEDYAMGRLAKLPEELKLFKDEFAMARKAKAKGCEEMWCFKNDWSETHDKDWGGIWVRIKIDLWVLEGDTLHIIDHKTGKNRGGYEDQLELYAVGGFLKFPNVKKVVTYLWFLDSGDTPDKEYSSKDLAKLKKKWEGKVAPMLADTSFHPKPSAQACKYCFYSKKKNGPCRF